MKLPSSCPPGWTSAPIAADLESMRRPAILAGGPSQDYATGPEGAVVILSHSWVHGMAARLRSAVTVAIFGLLVANGTSGAALFGQQAPLPAAEGTAAKGIAAKGTAQAAGPCRLTLDEAKQRALGTNQLLALAGLNVQSKQFATRAMQANYFPQV